MPVPGPPPASAGTQSPGSRSPEFQSPAGTQEPGVSALDEVRARLDALDDVPLEQHPEQFTSIDSLLRSALDGTDRALRS